MALIRDRISPLPPPMVGNKKYDVLNFVLERKRASEEYYQSTRKRAARLYQFYRGWYRGTHVQQFRNNVTLPLIFSTIQSDVARKVGTLFGQFPYVQLVGGGQEDWPAARQYELFLAAQMDDADIFTRSVRFLLASEIYGTACAEVGWRYREEQLVRRPGATAWPSQQEVQSESESIVAFDGPDWEPIDIVDTFPEPKVPELARMRWFGRRYTLEFEDCEAYAKHGVFDAAAVRELRGVGLRFDLEDTDKEMRSQNFFESYPDRYSKPVVIFEMKGVVPDDFAKNGMRMRVITVANESVVLRNRPMALQSAVLPFVSAAPMVDPHYFYGPSKAEIGERFQFVASRLTNQKLDAMDLVIDPMWAYDRNADIATRDLFTKAGKLIGMNGVPSQVLQAISPDIRGLQLSYSEIEQMWRWYQMASGIIEDTVMGGGGGSDRQTAREYLGRVESVSTRLLMETRLIEEQFIRPLSKHFIALNAQYLTVPMRRAIAGSGAIVDPVTGIPLADVVEVTMDDLYRQYDVRPVASTMALPKSARQQNLLILLQAMTANPMAAQAVNWMTFFRQIFRDFEFANVDELLLTGPQQQLAALLARGEASAMAAAQGGMGGMGGPPGPAPMMPGVDQQTLPMLSPMAGGENQGI